MSIALPIVDLSSAGVGTKGTVSFQNAGIGIGGADSNPAFTQNRPHINVFNDSKCSLYITFIQEGHSDHLTPGAWRMYDLTPGEGGFNWLVESVMNVAAPISQLSATYYFPNESVDSVGTLGNSPIGGGVSTSSVQTLSNEGGARALLVLDIGDLALANLINFFTDSFFFKVDQSGVAHTVLQGKTSGNPLLVGQAGDISEILGQLLVDQLATFTGNIVASGGMNNNTFRDNVAGNPAMDLSAGDGTVAFPQIIKPNIAGTPVNGSVAGNVTMYTPLWGSACKIAILAFAGWNSTTQVIFTLPSSASRGVFYMGNLGGFVQIGFGTAGVVGGMVLSTSLGTASAAGATAGAGANGAFSNSLGELISTQTQLIVNNGSNGGVLSGAFVFIGV